MRCFRGYQGGIHIFGGRGGKGVISRRVKGGWTAPAFFNLGGGSFGAQIGAQKNDYIFLIMNEDGVKGLLEDKFEMGGEAGLVAGPVGRQQLRLMPLLMQESFHTRVAKELYRSRSERCCDQPGQ